MRTILLVGEDRSLLELRAEVLSRFFTAQTFCHKPVDLDRQWPSDPLDLVILCHSLGEETRQQVISRVRSSDQALKILQIESNVSHHRATEADAFVGAEPQKLVDKVFEMFID